MAGAECFELGAGGGGAALTAQKKKKHKKAEMDDLPQCVLELILARLSGSAPFRAAAVSKPWYRILSNQNLEVTMARRRLVLCSSRYSVAWQYDFGSKKWSQISVDFDDLPSGPCIPLVTSSTQRFRGAAGGLLFLEVKSDMPRRFYVCDPFTQSVDVLPDLLHLTPRHFLPVESRGHKRPPVMIGYRAADVVAVKAPGRLHEYKLVAIDHVSRTVQVFDTCTSCWTHVANISDCMHGCTYTGEVATLGYGARIFYKPSFSDELYLLDLRKEGSKQVEDRRWTTLNFPDLHSTIEERDQEISCIQRQEAEEEEDSYTCLTFNTLRLRHCNNNRLLMVGGVPLEERNSNSTRYYLASINVWELHLQSQSWKLLTTMPNHLRYQISRFINGRLADVVIHCYCVGDYVCFHGATILRVLAYHLPPHDSWAFLPSLPSEVLEERVSQVHRLYPQNSGLVGNYFQGFEFEPSTASDFLHI